LKTLFHPSKFLFKDMFIIVYYKMNNNKPTVKLKTIQFNIHNKHKNILSDMTTISKNIFNCCVYSNNIFYLFKNKVYQELYLFLKEINKSKLSETNKKILINLDNKNILLQKLKHYYDFYNENHHIMITNNKIIYEHIKNKAINLILTSTNIKQFYKKITEDLVNIVNFNETNKKYVFIDIVDRIIKSFYNKTYFLTKYQMNKHIPFTYNSDQLKNDIINGYYYYDTSKTINYKQKIQKKFQIELKSEQYLFKLFVYEYCLGANKEKLPADIILNLIDKYSEAIKSYYGLINKKLPANKPKYLNKDDKFNLYYFPSSFKIKDNIARLTIGKYAALNYNKYNNDLLKITDRKYCYKYNLCSNIKNKIKKNYIKTPYGYIHNCEIIDGYYLNLKLPSIIKNKKVKQIQIKSYGNIFTAYVTYEEPNNDIELNEPITSLNSISIDTGIKNLMTIYNPTGNQYIIKGGKIKAINEFYNKQISKLQSINAKSLNLHKFNRLYSLLNERKNKLNGLINKIINKLIETYNNKKYFIIGYNEGWKTKVNMGHNNNKHFYDIPYSRIISKLKEKLLANGKQLIINEESYTSKCDSLSLEKLEKNENYLGNRIHRGLFISSTGKAINADLNGAINIMRKIVNLQTISGKKIFNPQILAA
jgi:putative transposase